MEGSPLQLEMEILDKGNKKKVRGKRPAEDAQDESFTESIADRIKRTKAT